ncbi:TIGR00266 family protein [Scytonema sp. UIC 10036]|uniref:TIGR00266 family protein n=1 Tax=Scytonema sp. UIC 10036 TaxID=2304196 RepID=UPI0012DA6EF5|nr:TIGR00266 family protein [Scytonema sp. UIC 10036]MUG96925.1 TIGR00266 family protein [Scytonema sp. UIC 10036]
MQVELMYQHAYTLGRVRLVGGEKVRVEAASMVGMSSGVTLETTATGGFFKSLGRAFLGGESFFQNIYTAPSQGGEVLVAPSLPGDLTTLDVTEPMLVQSGAYVASDMSVEVDSKWGGSKSFFGAGGGLFMLRAQGQGQMVVSSYGAIHEITLEAGQSYTLDTGHLVALPESMSFKIRSIGGIKTFLFSGEGLVADLTGPGKFLVQTRSQDQFLSWLIPKLPQPSSSSSS